MPRYFFHVHDGQSQIDTEGTILKDVVQARQAAIRMAGQIFDDEAHLVSFGEEWRMEVTNQDGLLLFRLDFVVTEAPALGIKYGK